MRIIENQRGFTLVEIVIAIGLLGGISIVTMKLMEDQANNKAHLVAKTEIAKAMSMLKATLNKSDTCRAMLSRQFLNDTLGGTGRVIQPPPALPAPSITPAVQAGLYQRVLMPNSPVGGTPVYTYKEMLVLGGNYGNFRVNDIRLVRVTNTNTNVDQVNLEVRFGVEKKSILFRSDGNSVNDRTYLHKIPLTVTIENSAIANQDKIMDCGIVMSEAAEAAKEKFCESLGNMADWDDVAKKCVFNDLRCDYGEVPGEQNSGLGENTYGCVPIADKFDAHDLFDETPCPSVTGKFRIESVGGKLRVKCE